MVPSVCGVCGQNVVTCRDHRKQINSRVHGELFCSAHPGRFAIDRPHRPTGVLYRTTPAARCPYTRCVTTDTHAGAP